MALLAASPAIGMGIQAYYDYPGTSDPITTDQRGFALDSPIDLGAFQSQTGLVVTPTPTRSARPRAIWACGRRSTWPTS